MVALTIEVPPISRPRGSHSSRPSSVPERSVLKKSQSNSGMAGRLPAVLATDREQRRHDLLVGESRGRPRSAAPGSPGFSVSRAAATPPLDPAPTTMTSYRSMQPPLGRVRASEISWRGGSTVDRYRLPTIAWHRFQLTGGVPKRKWPGRRDIISAPAEHQAMQPCAGGFPPTDPACRVFCASSRRERLAADDNVSI